MNRSQRVADLAQPREVEHTCAGIDHVTIWAPERVVKLGRGWRLEGWRCDGTRLHVVLDDDGTER